MDLLERLADTINELSLPIRCMLGYLGASDSLVVYPLPGGTVEEVYMDGRKDEVLNYEVAMKSRSQENISQSLWMITRHLQEVKDIQSETNSFEFDGLQITNMPFINQADDQGYYTFLLGVQIKVTTLSKGE